MLFFKLKKDIDKNKMDNSVIESHQTDLNELTRFICHRILREHLIFEDIISQYVQDVLDFILGLSRILSLFISFMCSILLS